MTSLELYCIHTIKYNPNDADVEENECYEEDKKFVWGYMKSQQKR